jgi:hypothetical protein
MFWRSACVAELVFLVDQTADPLMKVVVLAHAPFSARSVNRSTESSALATTTSWATALGRRCGSTPFNACRGARLSPWRRQGRSRGTTRVAPCRTSGAATGGTDRGHAAQARR